LYLIVPPRYYPDPPLEFGGTEGGGGMGSELPPKGAWIKLWLPPHPFEIPGYVPADRQ